MSDTAILEVIIGMIFVFSLLSILVTQINSVMTAFLNLRTRHLRDALDDLVTDPILQAKIVTHPLIRLVRNKMVLPDQRISDEQARQIFQSTLNRVDWISPKTFSNVLISILKVDSDRELFGVLLNVIDGMPAGPDRRRLRLIVNRLITAGGDLDDLRHAIGELSEPIYRDALFDALAQVDDTIGQMGLSPNSIVSLNAGLRNIKNPYFRTAMETILATSHNLAEAEEQIKEWFDEGMDRASATFGRTMQFFSLLTGILIAITLNVDTLQLARTLWEDPALRAAVADAAEQADLASLAPSANITVPAQPIDPNDASAQNLDATVEELNQAVSDARATVNTLLGLRLPIGWRYSDLSQLDPQDPGNALLFDDAGNLYNYIPGKSPYWSSLIFKKTLGLLLTMIAIAQGAPFWFNLLRRLTNGGSSS